MKEQQLRPIDLMQENARLRILDLKQVLLKKNSFVHVPCPGCEGKGGVFWFNKDGFTFVRCTICQTAWISPRPTLQLLRKFYKESLSIRHWDQAIYPASEAVRRRFIFKPRAHKVQFLVRKYAAGITTMVDVGSGFGTFGEEISKLHVFNRVIAVEPSPELAATCRRKKLKVVESTIETARLPQIDVMTNFELIEHLFSPRDFLLSCRKFLKPNGLLILTTPNRLGFDMLTLGKKSDHFSAPNHLNYFHPHSIRILLSTCGFIVREILTPGKLDVEIVRKKAILKKISLSNQPFLQHILLDRWKEVGTTFQRFLSANQLSSHMWVVAQKE